MSLLAVVDMGALSVPPRSWNSSIFIVMLRIPRYASDFYWLFNAPMRKQQCPHPIKTTIYFLYDALKNLLKVGAKLDPELYHRGHLPVGPQGQHVLRPQICHFCLFQRAKCGQVPPVVPGVVLVFPITHHTPD